jgi:hypothetical protein
MAGRVAKAEAQRDGAMFIAAAALSIMTDDQLLELRNRLGEQGRDHGRDDC